jgi:hypothetical protein
MPAPFLALPPGLPHGRHAFAGTSATYALTGAWGGALCTECPAQDCANGGLNGLDEFIITLREEMVFQWCAERRIPVAYCLAGGYIGKRMSQRKLVDLHRLTILSASNNSWRFEN